MNNTSRTEPQFHWILDRMRPALLRRQVPHAILIESPSLEIGSEEALALTRQFLASDPNDNACHVAGHKIYQQVESGAHPDFDRIAPDAKSSNRSSPIIAVDQVRKAVERFHFTPVASQGKVLLIEPANALNSNAVAALLKIMEEPPGGSLIILVTTNRLSLLDTIRSRCLTLTLPKESKGSQSDLSLLSEHVELYRDCLGGLEVGKSSAQIRHGVTSAHGSKLDTGLIFSLLDQLLRRAVDAFLDSPFEAVFQEEQMLLKRYAAEIGLDRLVALWDKLQQRRRDANELFLDPAVSISLMLEDMAARKSN